MMIANAECHTRVRVREAILILVTLLLVRLCGPTISISKEVQLRTMVGPGRMHRHSSNSSILVIKLLVLPLPYSRNNS